MSKAHPDAVAAMVALVRERLDVRPERLCIAGLCGSQGSGKSTLASAVRQALEADGISAAILSLDDLYLTRAERERLAREVHPLLATRGVPGTHDVTLGLSIVDALRAGEGCRLPRFDKLTDDRLPQGEWDEAPAGCRVLLFEGWCVGAVPQCDADLAAPVNELERAEDTQAIWRRHVNTQLAGPYSQLFAALDCLAMLQAPGFEVVLDWRLEQERGLASERDGGMSRDEVARFIAFYERLTRHILAEMPARADLAIALDRNRVPFSIRR